MARAVNNSDMYDLLLLTDQLEIASHRNNAAKNMYAY